MEPVNRSEPKAIEASRRMDVDRDFSLQIIGKRAQWNSRYGDEFWKGLTKSGIYVNPWSRATGLVH
jgi:hypothetical protein